MKVISTKRADLILTEIEYRMEKQALNIYRVSQKVTEVRGEKPKPSRNYSRVQRVLESPLTVSVESLGDIVRALGGDLYIVFPDE